MPRTKAAQPKHGSEGRMKIGEREIDNPYGVGPKRIKAQVNEKTDAIESLYARGRIDAAQKHAGDRIRALYERMQSGGARGVDLEAVRVDGGQTAKSESLSQLQAIEALGGLVRDLGKSEYALVILCAGECLDLRTVANRWAGRKATRDELTFVSQTVQSGLTEAAVHFGFKSQDTTPSARLARLSHAQDLINTRLRKGG
ncbi:MAG: hypothetical protein AAF739_00355 [Pseudomonadota bacterium]